MRLRTVQFLPMHKKIAEILGRAGITLPDSDKAKAIERLQGLSKHIAIQSNIAMSADHEDHDARQTGHTYPSSYENIESVHRSLL